MKYLLLLTAIWVTSCFSVDSPPPSPEITADTSFVRDLLDSNGLQKLSISEVVKVLNPQHNGHEDPIWYLDFSKKNLSKFRFVDAVKKFKVLSIVDLTDNFLTTVPEGIATKKWTILYLDRNTLCNLSYQDSLSLEKANATWKGSQYCPP